MPKIEEEIETLIDLQEPKMYRAENPKARCVLIDCGVKMNIIRSLVKRHCEVIQVPYNTKYDEILEYKPDFVLISNGPGDPARLKEVIENIKNLIHNLKEI